MAKKTFRACPFCGEFPQVREFTSQIPHTPAVIVDVQCTECRIASKFMNATWEGAMAAAYAWWNAEHMCCATCQHGDKSTLNNWTAGQYYCNLESDINAVFDPTHRCDDWTQRMDEGDA